MNNKAKYHLGKEFAMLKPNLPDNLIIRFFHIFLPLLMASFFVFSWAAEPRGMTVREFEQNAKAEGQLLPCAPIERSQVSQPEVKLWSDDWVAVDSLNFDTILDADQRLGLLWSNSAGEAIVCGTQSALTNEARQAITKAPVWIQPELSNILAKLETADQQIWSNLINSAADPYVDEIAFTIATSSVAWLTSIYADPQLVLENAQQLYTADAQLPYVQINDYGNSVSGGDYYSTTSYQKINADSQLVQVEVPREIYYWYIVHPKLTDEIPAFINPAIIESNSTHANNIAAPPTGQFWRTFFFSAQEENYPCLADTLSQLTSVYNRVGPANDVIHAIQWWVNNTMSFTSNSERPHQPVRIYRKHIGRCGEYGDYTEAAARTALIPCTQITSISTDHVWNEFWDEGWVQWEPVNGYINMPLVYENGWGKVFGSVFETRSDGCLTSVTDRYSEGISTLNFTVTDSLGQTVDGARIILAIYESGIRTDMVDFTDNQGQLTLPVGENRHYYVRVTSPVGIYPPNAGTYVSIVENSIAGETYNFTLPIPAAFTAPQITTVPFPEDPLNDWQLGIMFSVPHQYINGQVAWDDIDITGQTPRFYERLNQAGTVNLLFTDADNYLFYEISHTCEAYGVLENAQSGSGTFNIPSGQDWYGFADNANHVSNAQQINGALIYRHFGVANDDQHLPSAVFTLTGNYPNPFGKETEIAFNLKQGGQVKLCIYNSKGQKVKELRTETLKAGRHTLKWDATDADLKMVGSGVYFCTVSSNGQTRSCKLLLLR